MLSISLPRQGNYSNQSVFQIGLAANVQNKLQYTLNELLVGEPHAIPTFLGISACLQTRTLSLLIIRSFRIQSETVSRCALSVVVTR